MTREQLLEILRALSAASGRNSAALGKGGTVELTAHSIQNSPIQIGDGIQLIINGLLSKDSGPSPSIVRSRLSLAAPPLSEYLIPRSELTTGLLTAYEHHVWLALHGSIGEGKTHLAALIGRDKIRGWIRFGGLDTSDASTLLVEALTTIGGSAEHPSKRAAESLGADVYVVLHNMPKLLGHEPICDQLVEFARACELNGVRIVSTAHHPFPSAIVHRVHIDERPSPMLNNDDSREMLLALGAPKPILSPGFLKLVAGLSGGHAGLVAAIGRFLKQRNWDMATNAIDELLRGAHADDLVREALDRLVGTTTPGARDLLYRLRLALGVFQETDVQLLAAVPPVIDRPLEKMRELEGIWARRLDNGWLLAPIIDQVPPDIDKVTKKGCHAALARRLWTQSSLGYWEARELFIHLSAADAFQGVVGLLASVYTGVLHEDEQSAIHSHVRFWLAVNIPEEVPRSFRFYLLGLRAAVALKYNINPEAILSALDVEFTSAGNGESGAAIAIVAVTAQYLRRRDPERAKRYHNLAMALMSDLRWPDGSSRSFPAEHQIGTIAWINAGLLATEHDFASWFSALEATSDRVRTQALHGPLTSEAALVMANGPWMQESEKKQPDWPSVEQTLQFIASRALQLDSEVLWAAAIRGQMIVLGEYRKDLLNAIALAELTLSSERSPIATLLISECAGRQYLYVNRRQDAIPWLERAISQNVAEFVDVRIWTSLSAAQACDADPQRSLAHAERSFNIAEQWTDIPKLFKATVLGELTIARWRALGAASAYESLEEIVELLLGNRSDGVEWKKSMVLAAHTSMYLAGLMRGDIRDIVGDRSDISPPIQGMFARPADGLERRYRDFFGSGAAAMLTLFAHHLDREQAARYWARRAFVEAGELASLESVAPLAGAPLKYLIVDNAIEDALAIAWALGSYTPVKVPSGGSAAVASFATFGLIPAVVHAATICLHDRETGIAIAQRLVVACRKSGHAGAIYTEMEQRAAAIEFVFLGDPSLEAVAREAKTTIAVDSNVVRAILYIGAAVSSARTPTEALMCQLSYVMWLSELYQGDTVFLDRILGAFVERFWQQSFDQAGFLFRAPKVVEEDLRKARSLRGVDKIRTILRIVTDSLGRAVPDECQAWLRRR